MQSACEPHANWSVDWIIVFPVQTV